MEFHELKSLAKHNKQTFGRIVNCEMYKLEEKVLAITRMHDDFHDLQLAMLINKDYEIEDVAVSMDRIPFPQCGIGPPATIKKLKGLSVYGKGVMKRVRELIPRKEGCAHLYEMIESTFRAVFTGYYYVLGDSFEGALTLDIEEERQLWIANPVLADTCYSFSTETADEEILGKALAKVDEARKRAMKIKVIKED